jgi:ATP-dependent helicase/nuclease subunit B
LLCAFAPLRENFPVQARFLLGPAGSGKTFRCLKEIRDALAKSPEGEPLVFLAPKQATFQIERQLLADKNLSGFTRLHILSSERLARFVFEKLNVAPPELLSDEGRVMVLRALLLRHSAELTLFSKSARRPGFARQIGQLLRELQQHQIAPAKLRALAGQNNLRPELRDKLHDLALLSDKYAGWLHENGLQDANRLLDVATEALRKNFSLQPSAFNVSGLWLDGFAEMSPQEMDLLATVIPFCENATLAFCLDNSSESESSWLSIWNGVNKTFQQCRARLENLPNCKIKIENLPRNPKANRFPTNPELAHLEQSWAQPTPNSHLPSAISINSCANPDAEAVFAAREILKFVRAGNRFRDCAVLVRDLENFHKPLARAFRRYEIPFFLDRRESVAHHPLAELTRGTLRTVAFDWKNEDWFTALKSGFCAVDENEIDRLENAALEFGWRGKKWLDPLPDASFERLRKQILPPFGNFSMRLARLNFEPNGIQLAEIMRELWEDLRVEERLQSWSGEASSASTHTSVFGQMNSWLDNLALAFPRERMELREWLPILEAGLANLTVGVIPPVLDEVLVGAIDRARNPDLKFALVLGVNESVFPAAPSTPAILTDADREEVQIPLGPNSRDQISRERFYGYIACTRASEKLALTFSRQCVDGKTLNPSPFIAHLKMIFSKLEVGEFSDQLDWRVAEHANELIPLLVQIQNPPEIPALKSLAEKLAQLREPEVSENLSRSLAEKIYGPVLRSSVSRLEEFAQCPFKFFTRVGLRAGERKIFELDARERGNFQHDVLKKFHEQIVAEKRGWRDLTPEEARERIKKIADTEMESFRKGLLRDSAETIFAARAMTVSLQNFIGVITGWMRTQYEFDPVAAELNFGGEESPDTALDIDLGRSRKLALQGRIDRVDLWREPGKNSALAVVMDYKSGGNKLDALLVENGIQLQLLAYLAALRRWKKPRGIFSADELIPAGAFYVNLRGFFEGGATRDEILGDTDSPRLAYRHNGRFDAGALDKLDSANAADQFNYNRNKDGTLRKGSTEALPRGEFEKLLDSVESRMREIGVRIFSGEASVDPYRKGQETPCKFCDYRAACRIDEWTHEWRVLRAAKTPVSDTPEPS